MDFWRVFFGYVGAGASVVYHALLCKSAPLADDDMMMYHGVADDDDDVVIKQPAKRLG